MILHLHYFDQWFSFPLHFLFGADWFFLYFLAKFWFLDSISYFFLFLTTNFCKIQKHLHRIRGHEAMILILNVFHLATTFHFILWYFYPALRRSNLCLLLVCVSFLNFKFYRWRMMRLFSVFFPILSELSLEICSRYLKNWKDLWLDFSFSFCLNFYFKLKLITFKNLKDFIPNQTV